MTNPSGAVVSIAFVMGARRTGTTALYQLLCSSRDTHPFVGEFQMLTQLLQAFAWGRSNYDRLVRFFFRDPERFARFQAETARALVLEAVESLAPKHCAVFKNPELSLYVADLAEIFPFARFVATIRDPLDQVASELEVGARKRRDGARAEALPPVRNLAARFNAYYQAPQELREARPERIHFVRYEDLVTAPVDTVRCVTDFLGISPEGIDPSAEWNFGQVDPDAMRDRPSWSGLYGKPISPERIGRHRELLTPDQIATIKADTADLGALFGYGPNR